MSQRVREELLPRLRQRYANRGREGKSRLIDELVEDFGYSRKHAIKLLNARAGWGGQLGVPRGRPARYGPEVVHVLKTIWKAAEQPCGKRLSALLGEWLPFYEEEHGKLPRKAKKDVLEISPSLFIPPMAAQAGVGGVVRSQGQSSRIRSRFERTTGT